MRVMTGRRRMAVAAVSAAALFAAAACGSDNGDDSGDNGDNGNGGDVTLSLHDFGGEGFGYGERIQQFEAENPNITVDYQTTTDNYDEEYRPTLIQELDAGSAPDVAAFEEQGVGQMMSLTDAWVDLAQYGLDAREQDYPAWKWELGFTNDGKLAGLGTDVGGLALCYRTDVFADAGLPTDREEVAQLWPTWEAFADVAAQFVASGVDVPFVDGMQQLYNTRLIQEAGAGDGTSYFDRDNNYVLAESPAVQTTFNYMIELYELGAIGPFENWTEEWNAAMAEGGYGVMGCPAWMMGVIEGTAGEDNLGNWDVAPVPGVGGNWGGSWLGVTKDSDHPEEAAALVDFLTSVDGQLAAWGAVSAFPSAPAAQEDPAVADTVNAYFNDAPTGQLIAGSIVEYEPVFFGALHSAVRNNVENVLVGVSQDSVSVDEAWDAFVGAGQEVVDLEG